MAMEQGGASPDATGEIEDLRKKIESAKAEFNSLKDFIFSDPELIELKNLEYSISETAKYRRGSEDDEQLQALQTKMKQSPRYGEYAEKRSHMKSLQMDIQYWITELKKKGGEYHYE